MDTLTRLQKWYSHQCNGEWEHSFGVTIQSCDNPGWWVKIDLAGTSLLKKPFNEIAEGVNEHRCGQGPRWISCYTENGVWHGAGDELKLERILAIFLNWAEENGD